MGSIRLEVVEEGVSEGAAEVGWRRGLGIHVGRNSGGIG